jgi:hypothetical protein
MTHTYIETCEDFVLSIVVGGLLSFVLIHFGSKKTVVSEKVKEIFEGTNSEENDESKVSKEEQTVFINEQSFIEKTKKIQKVLGLTEEQIKEAIKETNDQLKKGVSNDVVEDSFSWASVMDGCVILFVVIAVCQSINIMTHGDFARAMAGFFPNEVESIKVATDRFKNMLKIISSHIQTVSNHFEL